jgi:hypothetical protein
MKTMFWLINIMLPIDAASLSRGSLKASSHLSDSIVLLFSPSLQRRTTCADSKIWNIVRQI